MAGDTLRGCLTFSKGFDRLWPLSSHGLLPEKIDVHRVSAKVAAAEYGNQGGDRGSYSTPREQNPLGFGWTNASFITLYAGLSPQLRAELDRGAAADQLFPRHG